MKKKKRSLPEMKRRGLNNPSNFEKCFLRSFILEKKLVNRQLYKLKNSCKGIFENMFLVTQIYQLLLLQGLGKQKCNRLVHSMQQWNQGDTLIHFHLSRCLCIMERIADISQVPKELCTPPPHSSLYCIAPNNMVGFAKYHPVHTLL